MGRLIFTAAISAALIFTVAMMAAPIIGMWSAASAGLELAAGR